MFITMLGFRFFGPVHLHAPVATKFGLGLPLLMRRIDYRLFVRGDIVNQTLTMLHLDVLKLGKLLPGLLFTVLNLVRHQVIVAQNFEGFLSDGGGACSEARLFGSSFHQQINFRIHVLLSNRRSVLNVFFERLVLIVSRIVN